MWPLLVGSGITKNWRSPRPEQSGGYAVDVMKEAGPPWPCPRARSGGSTKVGLKTGAAFISDVLFVLACWSVTATKAQVP